VDSKGWVGSHSSLALDRQNNPHISYTNSTKDDLYHARYDPGFSWILFYPAMIEK
jgi:hypothetical protein